MQLNIDFGIYKELKSINSLSLVSYGKPLALEGFTDSDFAACRDTRRSTSGYIFKLGGATISWRSRKQRSVAISTLEAEYHDMACTQAAK